MLTVAPQWWITYENILIHRKYFDSEAMAASGEPVLEDEPSHQRSDYVPEGRALLWTVNTHIK